MIKIETALNSYFFAASMIRDCEKSGGGIGRCSHCEDINETKQQIGKINESLLVELDMFYNEKLGLQSLNSGDLLDEYERPTEVTRRLKMLKDTRGDEEVPASFSQLFEELTEAISRHPNVD